jgi:hypothetical protein
LVFFIAWVPARGETEESLRILACPYFAEEICSAKFILPWKRRISCSAPATEIKTDK